MQSETILLDLKHLLKEAKQRVPPVLDALDDPMEALAEMQVRSLPSPPSLCLHFTRVIPLLLLDPGFVLICKENHIDFCLFVQANSGIKGCSFCGGLGHRIGDCPKLRSQAKANARGTKDYLGAGGFGAEC